MWTNLSDFLDLAATLANEWATLAGRHNKAHGDRWFAGGRTVSHWGANVLEGGWDNEDFIIAIIFATTRLI